MNAKSKVSVRADRHGMTFPGGLVASAAVATLVLVLAPAAAHAAEAGGSVSAGKSPPATLESIPGGTTKRVTLTAKAAERLGIQTGKVAEEAIVRKQMVGGLVIAPVEKPPDANPASGGSGGFGGFGKGAPVQAPKPASNGPGGTGALQKAAALVAPQPVVAHVTGEVWVLVSLSPVEWDRLAKDKPARLLALGTREKLANELLAMPTAMPPVEDVKRTMLSMYYVVPGRAHGLTLNSRVRVELEQSGNAEKQKAVPYASVYYDGKGVTWVYVNTKPLVFERQRVTVERIVGDLAFLSDGPSVGTPVVTVGASMLFGAEIFGK
ncbi:MAG: hypothetical protein ACREBY_18760 [Polaromonas sp.]